MISADRASALMSQSFDAGASMHNVALTLGDLKRHSDALVLRQKVLDFFQRLLPEDHHAIGKLDGAVTAFQ